MPMENTNQSPINTSAQHDKESFVAKQAPFISENGNHNPPGKTTATPMPDPDVPLSALLEEDEPRMETPSAASLSGFETKEEAWAWAIKKARLHPTCVKWMSRGASTVEGLVPKEARLEAQAGRLTAQARAEPDMIELTVFDPRYHEKFSVLTNPAKTFALICWTTCFVAICSVLAAEFGFEVTAAMESRHSFLQNWWGAFCIVFSISFGSLLVLTFWLAAEKGHTWNWALKMVARIGAIGSVSLVVVLGIVLGKPEDELFAWPMVLIPLSAIVLICSAIGAKEALMWVCTKALPLKNVKNKKIAKCWEESASLEEPIKDVKVQKTNAKKLMERATDFTEEFAGRVVEAWRRVKHWEKSEAEAREASRRKMLAAVEEELAADALKNLARPE